MTKKILFNDKCGLTNAVLSGIKDRTMRECKIQCPNSTYKIIFPELDDSFGASPFAYCFKWGNTNTKDYTAWNKIKYKVGEVVAIAQCYKDVLIDNPSSKFRDIILDNNYDPKPEYKAGYTNKMFVNSSLMPHHIKIINIGIQRPQNLIEEEILREGISKYDYEDDCGNHHISYSYSLNEKGYPTAKESFKELLYNTCGKDFYDRNPFCFVYDFILID